MVYNIAIPVLSRANYGRLKSVLQAIKEHPELELQLIVGASALLDRFGCVDVIEADGFHIDERLYCVVDGGIPQTMVHTTGILASQLATCFERLKPDIVLVHADRYEMLAVAMAASYMNIPLAHNQGGEVTGSIDDKVRNAITQLADMHFVATEDAMDRVMQMRNYKGMFHNLGCPSLDIIPSDLEIREDFCAKYGGVGPKLDLSQPYLVVMQHPVTTEFGHGEQQIRATLDAIKQLHMQTVWLWPNVDAGSDEISGLLRRFRENEKPEYIHFFKNLPPEDYYRLIANCSCLIGNTSSGIREGSYLGVPYVSIGSRQYNRDCATNVIYCGYSREDISASVFYMLKHGKFQPSNLYGDGKAGRRIAEILCEYYA